MRMRDIAMSKHTPGPWTPVVNEWDEALLEPEEWYWYVIAPDESVIATRLAKPDARLIAAAPDLLAALRDLLPMVEWYAGHLKDDFKVAAARAAIAKAEGTS